MPGKERFGIQNFAQRVAGPQQGSVSLKSNTEIKKRSNPLVEPNPLALSHIIETWMVQASGSPMMFFLLQRKMERMDASRRGKRLSPNPIMLPAPHIPSNNPLLHPLRRGERNSTAALLLRLPPIRRPRF